MKHMQRRSWWYSVLSCFLTNEAKVDESTNNNQFHIRNRFAGTVGQRSVLMKDALNAGRLEGSRPFV
jgi:ribosomal protein S17E